MKTTNEINLSDFQPISDETLEQTRRLMKAKAEASCECASLDWTGEDMTAEHHPKCQSGQSPYLDAPPIGSLTRLSEFMSNAEVRFKFPPEVYGDAVSFLKSCYELHVQSSPFDFSSGDWGFEKFLERQKQEQSLVFGRMQLLYGCDFGDIRTVRVNDLLTVCRITKVSEESLPEGGTRNSVSWEILDVISPPEAREAWLKMRAEKEV